MTKLSPPGADRRHRTLFISDVHLGTRGCQADLLVDFLAQHPADRIFLVGDIFDGWRLTRGWHWPQHHNDVIQALLSMAHDGVPITFIPGNHDEVMRRYLGTHFGGIVVSEFDVHVTADGRRFLVTHGDQFDAVVMNAKWLAHVGDRAYASMLWLNTWLNWAKRLWGGQYWSLSNWAKQQVKRAVNYIGEYEKVLADEARRGGYDGVICGHIHHATISRIEEIEYINCGDWVESCTAIIEEQDGTLRLVEWPARQRRERRRMAARRRRRGQGEEQVMRRAPAQGRAS